MKKICIIFLTLFIISLTAVGFSGVCVPTDGVDTTGYFRIHIRADSNEVQAQAVKYLVRDEIVEYLTPLVASYQTKAEAEAGVKANIESVKKVAERVLRRNGFDYGARVQIKRESFPTRVYGEYTLPAGAYTALIVELGEGAGDNWWCVVYPPLCFTAGENVVYKSKILEIIERWKGAGMR